MKYLSIYLILHNIYIMRFYQKFNNIYISCFEAFLLHLDHLFTDLRCKWYLCIYYTYTVIYNEPRYTALSCNAEWDLCKPWVIFAVCSWKNTLPRASYIFRLYLNLKIRVKTNKEPWSNEDFQMALTLKWEWGGEIQNWLNYSTLNL